MNEISAAGRAVPEAPNGIVMQATHEAHALGDRLAKLNSRMDGLRSRVFGPLPPTPPSDKDTEEPNSDVRRLEEAFERLRYFVTEIEVGIEAIEQI